MVEEAGVKDHKIQKIEKRPESTLSLEERFLPEVMKQRKEQEELHAVVSNSNESVNAKTYISPESCPKIGQGNSSSSLDGREVSIMGLVACNFFSRTIELIRERKYSDQIPLSLN